MSEVKRRELFPGVWLRAVHTNQFKSAYLSVTLMAPLDGATAAENALIPAVLRRGTRTHPDMESMSAALDELYGGAIEPVVRKKGETQCVGFVASFLDDAYTLEGEPILESAAALLGQVLLDPATENGVFRADYVAGEKANLLDRIRGQINDKRVYASHRLAQVMCREEAFGVDKLGDEESARAITPGSLWQRYQALLNTAAVEVYYSGSAQPERVERALHDALADLPVNPDRVVPDCEVRLNAGTQPQIVEEALDVTQGKLAMGFRTGGVTCWEEDYPAMVLCNAVFGGTTLSKLFMNVREKLSLCYYASSSYARSKKILTVSSGIEPKDYDRTLEEILHQLRQVQQGQWEPWELEGARSTALNSLRSVGDSQSARENFYMSRAAVDQQETPEELMQSLSAVTPERICAAAQSIRLDTVYFLRGKEAAQ